VGEVVVSVEYPVFLKERDPRVQEVRVYFSTTRLQDNLEAVDVENEEYLAWDAWGNVLRLDVAPGRRDWLRLTPTKMADMEGLRRAIASYAEVVGGGAGEIEGLTPAEAIKHIEDSQEREEQEKRRKRRWYQFRRGV